jgi:hypothetical protein
MEIGGYHEYVLRTQDEYQALIADANENFRVDCENYVFPTIDFSQYSLLGVSVQGGGCNYRVEKDVVRNDEHKHILYLINTTFIGMCKKSIYDNNFILVDAIPADYTVEFSTAESKE